MTLDEKTLIVEAIQPMFDACGNSYINAWLEDWLRRAAKAGCYAGPFVGRINELDLDDIVENSRAALKGEQNDD